MEELELLKLLLTEYLVEYYQVMRYEKNGEKLHFYFEEKNDIPEEYLKHQLSSKGFCEEGHHAGFSYSRAWSLFANPTTKVDES